MYVFDENFTWNAHNNKILKLKIKYKETNEPLTAVAALRWRKWKWNNKDD